MDETGDEIVLLEEAGQKISFLQAYPYHGRVLQELSLYDYMSVVKLKRKGKAAARRGEVEFDNTWPLSQTWVQALRDPGKNAIICLDGYLSMDFSKDDDMCYRRCVPLAVPYPKYPVRLYPTPLCAILFFVCIFFRAQIFFMRSYPAECAYSVPC